MSRMSGLCVAAVALMCALVLTVGCGSASESQTSRAMPSAAHDVKDGTPPYEVVGSGGAPSAIRGYFIVVDSPVSATQMRHIAQDVIESINDRSRVLVINLWFSDYRQLALARLSSLGEVTWERNQSPHVIVAVDFKKDWSQRPSPEEVDVFLDWRIEDASNRSGAVSAIASRFDLSDERVSQIVNTCNAWTNNTGVNFD